MTTADYLNQLQQDREDLVDNLEAKGISGLSGDETFTELVPEVLNISGGGGQTNIYRVPTIAQRNLINANEDDMCVVADNTLGNWQETTNASTLIFPEEVELSSAYMDWFDTMLRADQSSGVYFEGMIEIYDQEFKLQGWGYNIQVRVEYYSNDGITYTRQTIEAEDMSTQTSLVDGDTINLPFNVYIDGNWTDEIGYFMQTGIETFDGLFIYKNNAWEYAYVGANTNAVDLFNNKIAYTNNGFVSGTLGTTINNDLLKTSYKDICDCINGYKPTYINAMFRDITSTKLPITQIMDTSLATNMEYTFYNCKSLTYLDLSHWNTSSATTMSNMFVWCENLTSLDLSSFDTSQVANMESMFASCKRLTYLNLSSFTSETLTTTANMFNSCNALQTLDIRNLDMTNITNKMSMMNYVPTTCLIIVKDQTQKNWWATNYSSFTNVKTPSEL